MRGTKGTSALSLFEEIAGQPASMNNVRIALSLCALKNWEATVRDVEQAFLQAPLLRPERSTQCWASLTEDLWISEWREKRDKGIMPYADPLWKPCVPLLKALYGHPEAPALWERYLAEQLHSRGWVGFESIPGAWLHKKTKSIMMVYVDDLVLVCDPSLTKQLWCDLEMGQGGLEFQAEPEELCRYLGINHSWSVDNKSIHLTADMSSYLGMCLEEYYKESGIAKLAPVTSPFVEESQIGEDEWEQPATISSNQAAAHIMRLFFVARMCRPDLAVCITRLASRVSKWSRADDGTLKRVMQYIVFSQNYKLHFELPRLCDKDVCLRAWPDADLGGATHHSRSTSGLWLELYVPGRAGSWPIAWYARKQGATAGSTSEAEILALSTSMRREALPAMAFMEVVLGKKVNIHVHEDNAQVVSAVQKGYSPALVHATRTFRLSLSFLHEILCEREFGELSYVASAEHRGDLFTKAMSPKRFKTCCDLIGVGPPRQSSRPMQCHEGGVERET
eukprot:6491294-Amphidinium_carterae.1